jgi:hypothetical protein
LWKSFTFLEAIPYPEQFSIQKARSISNFSLQGLNRIFSKAETLIFFLIASFIQHNAGAE